MMVSHVVYCTLWTLLCFGQYLGQDLHLPEQTNGALGGIVVFNPENPPSTWTQVQWVFSNLAIITAVPGTTIIHPEYNGRVRFDNNTHALELLKIRLDDSGTYTLSVSTTAGGTFQKDTSLQVFVNISDVRLTGPKESLIEGESSLNITSEGSGSITSVQWMKDLSPLSPSDRIIFSSDNRSVSISPVQRSDTGEYHCTYRNPVSSDTAKLSLTINYGPEDVSVEGPGVVDLGVQVSLICSANSAPSASFSWTFNGSDTDVTTDTFTIVETDVTRSGDYSCTAWNSVTKRNASQRHALLVKAGGGEGGGGGLTAGAIAGIVIGVLVAVAGICGLIVYLTKKNKIPKLSLRSKEASEAPPSRTQPDLNYSEITHFQKSNEERVNVGKISDPNTEYAEVKLGAKTMAPPPPYGSQVSNAPGRR